MFLASGGKLQNPEKTHVNTEAAMLSAVPAYQLTGRITLDAWTYISRYVFEVDSLQNKQNQLSASPVNKFWTR